MALSILLDSVILIDHFNGIDAGTAYLKRVHGHAAISVITRAEVLTGFGEEQIPAVLALLARFPTLPVESETADLAAAFRRKQRWRLPDALQAALARLHRLKLATRNTRDFPPHRFDFVVVPYALS